jgi:hypothetical protein
MPDDLRITVDELRKRMEAGEDFTITDTRNPQAWAQSNEKLPGAIRGARPARDSRTKAGFHLSRSINHWKTRKKRASLGATHQSDPILTPEQRFKIASKQ